MNKSVQLRTMKTAIKPIYKGELQAMRNTGISPEYVQYIQREQSKLNTISRFRKIGQVSPLASSWT